MSPFHCYAECRYADCRYTVCRGTIQRRRKAEIRKDGGETLKRYQNENKSPVELITTPLPPIHKETHFGKTDRKKELKRVRI